ncbi:MAG: hypothetical protein FWE30_04285 [Bacteroidales bacterium]|nr:hypothetical protein [Bacteroidales bacterium]
MDNQTNIEKSGDYFEIKISTNETGFTVYQKVKDNISGYAVLLDQTVKHIKLMDKIMLFIEKQGVVRKDANAVISSLICGLNLSCIFIDFNVNISILIRDLFLSKSRPEQIAYIKYIYIELYRYLECHHKDFSKIKGLACSAGVELNFKKYAQLFNEFNNKHYEQIKRNRNTIFAHFDNHQDYCGYYVQVLALDIDECSKMCIEFLTTQQYLNDEIYGKIFSYQQKVMEKINTEVDTSTNDSKKRIYEKMELLRGLMTEEHLNMIKSKIDEFYNQFDEKFDEAFSKLFK